MHGAVARNSVLPAWPALRAFEAAARLGTFTRAAEALGISQSAVTRQIEALEAKAGTPLFVRARRGVSLTPEGQAYYADIAPAFEVIAAATARIGRRAAEEPLKIRVYPIFAMQWLIPRLADLRRWAPTLKLQFDPAVDPVDFDRDNLDIAIQFGPGERKGVDADLLIPDEIEPMCTSALAKSVRGLKSPADLRGLLLLHSHYRSFDWQDWMNYAAGPELFSLDNLVFPSSVLVYEAMRAGLGVAMGQTALLQNDLAEGRLIRPFANPLRRRLGYHLLMPHNKDRPPRTRAFRAWLLNMLEAERKAARPSRERSGR